MTSNITPSHQFKEYDELCFACLYVKVFALPTKGADALYDSGKVLMFCSIRSSRSMLYIYMSVAATDQWMIDYY